MIACYISLRNVFLGGYFHGRDHLTYGVDVGKIRWLGVLQVALCWLNLEVCIIFFLCYWLWVILIFEMAYATVTLHVESMLKVSASNFQRISIGYLLASISEIWFVNNIMVESLVDFARKYYNQWLVLLHIMLMLMNLSGPYICFPFCPFSSFNFYV